MPFSIYSVSNLMKTRMLTALAGIPALLILLFWPGGLPWCLAVAVLMGLAIWEYTIALQGRGIWVHWIAVAIYGVAILYRIAWWRILLLTRPAPYLYTGIAEAAPALWLWDPAKGHIGPAIALLVLLVGDLAWKRRNPIRNIGATMLGIGYIGALFPFLVLLRWTDFDLTFRTRPPGDTGAWFVLAVLAVIWAGDSAAYFGGRAWGKRKCAPAISPNKTWEGVFCGLAASAALGAVVWGACLHPRLEAAFLWSFGAVFGLLVGAAGQMGDLVESAMKRELGIKDFGTLLPGHGGVLDRFDSLLFAAPTAYLLISMLGRHLSFAAP